jgi:signal transduction histidine kinase
LKLRNAEKKAKESDKLKSAFLQNISHEIRTPMNSIIGFSELLTDRDITEEKKVEYLGIINSSCTQLLNVVNSIIEISMIESGIIVADVKKTDLNSALDEIYSSYSPLIRNGVMFSLQKGLPDREALIMTDESKLNKIISNMLSNAIKFTDKGHIIFGYEPDDNLLQFFVEDTGRGIPEDFKKHMFSVFQKADNDPDRLYEGLGLGLSICKGNLDLLNGSMWVESQTGIGTRFYFTIPYKPALS